MEINVPYIFTWFINAGFGLFWTACTWNKAIKLHAQYDTIFV